MSEEELKNKIEVAIREGTFDGYSEDLIESIVSLIKQERIRYGEELIGSIVTRMAELPYHPEIDAYEGGTSTRMVTYTTDLVALENELLRQRNKGEIE